MKRFLFFLSLIFRGSPRIIKFIEILCCLSRGGSFFLLGLVFFSSGYALTIGPVSTFSQDGKWIVEYTCDGKNIIPPLEWQGVPANAKSLALVLQDPDAPAGLWVHWIVYNMPVTQTKIDINGKNLPATVSYGLNTWGRARYDGPCPPHGRLHRYFWILYALDQPLNFTSPPTLQELKEKMRGHVLKVASTSAVYSRVKKQ